MIQKICFVGVLFAFILPNGLFAQDSQGINPAYVKYQEVGGPLPKLSIKTTQSKVLANGDLETGDHLFLVIFNPTCGTCIKMAKKMVCHGNLFKGAKVVFMAQPGHEADYPEFKEETFFADHPEFIMGTDRIGTINKLANYGMMPMIEIYDRNHKLVKTFNGNISLSAFKPYLP